MELTPHQQDGLAWLVAHVKDAPVVVSLTGYAGTGKTTMIRPLCQALRTQGLHVEVAAPTHRAVMMLRLKGIDEAETVHSLALLAAFSPDYVRALHWMGAFAVANPRSDDVLHDDIEGIPYLIAQACRPPIAISASALRQQNKQFSAQALLENLGIKGTDFFREPLPKYGNGCLILDEASMVDTTLLEKCQKAYKRIILVGDTGQLPPVEGTSVLDTVPGFHLTEIHRQAADSPIVRLATQARNGERFWKQLEVCEALKQVHEVSAEVFLTSPLLVYRNNVRESLTRRIRRRLGYPALALVAGEPLVCRSTNHEDHARGLYNNALFHIVTVDDTAPRHLLVRNDTGEEQYVDAHMEELDGKYKDPKATWFRFAYALTVHTAQGGEWPTGYLSQSELAWLYDSCTARKEMDLFRRWAYTAVTRAQTTLVIMMSNTSIVQPVHPLKERPMTETTPTPPGVTDMPDPRTSVPDDIPEPAVPVALAEAVKPALPVLPEGFGEHEAILQGFCQYLQKVMHGWMLEEHRSLTAGIDASLAGIRTWAQEVFASNEHAQYQLSAALAAWQKDGLPLKSDPYQASVRAVSPEGFPVTLQIVKGEAADLVSGLRGLMAWLKEAGFTPPPVIDPAFLQDDN